MKTVKIKPSSPDQGEFVIINESDFDPEIHKLADGESLKGEKLTITLNAKTAPELQQAINEANAECAKVTAENSELKEQLATAQGELIAFKNDVAAMQARIDELQPAAKKPTAAEVKAAKAAEEATKEEQPKE
ncbi:hypothetical protein EXE25_17985 [Acinetobacter bouvetii]|uniref:Uncharacterized protein n=1 Tax=Acinetobacter bouvetii TaxID=202951 RepID=A0A4Q7APM5_9GAMM|nr:hypothetical protein [Acinetobacter bouvetii]RZG63955.1 hypothetical protein EXE25_17985 [Acinetobacter bouvetii]